MLYPVILAGGSGTRLWPISTQSKPKQTKALLGDKTLLQNTYDRLLSGFDKKNIFIVSGVNLESAIKKQLKFKKENFFVEPQARGTSIAIGWAALVLLQKDPEAIIATINSDHHIKEEEKYIQAIKDSENIIEKNPDKILLMGIKPSYPETAYGYIELGEVIGDQIHKVNSYREKPNLETAKEFLSAGNYFWNSAIFVFKAKTLLEQYKKYIPDVYQTLMNIKEDPSSLEDEYEKVRNIPIDYSLMEKSEDLIIKPLDITWADIGSWRALRDIQQLIEGSKNISNSKNVLLDCQDNLLYSSSNKLITAIGIKDTVLVETEDTIFLCPAERSQELKDLLKEIKKRNLDKYL